MNPSWANSCSNLYIHGSFDQNKIEENDFFIHAVGTFRIEGEKDEKLQSGFNLSIIDCDKTQHEHGKNNIVCKLTKAISMARSEPPNSEKPNCALDLQIIDYQMKEIAPKILTGTVENGLCYNSFLTIDRNANRVNMSYTKTKSADNVQDGLCSDTPRTEVLMNCTAWPSIRKKDQSLSRYCDFSSSDGK